MSARRIAASIGWSVGLVALGCANTTGGTILDAGTGARPDASREDSMNPAMIDDVPLFPPQPPPPTFRLRSPISNHSIATSRPILRWFSPDSSAEHTVTVCADRPCTMVQDRQTVRGLTAQPIRDLPVGLHYWSVTTTIAGAPVSSHVWMFRTTWETDGTPRTDDRGGAADFNGDGFSDIIVNAPSIPLGEIIYGGPGVLVRTPIPPSDTAGERITRPLGAADFNGDGFDDLAVWLVTSEGHRLSILRGAAEGLSMQHRLPMASQMVERPRQDYTYRHALVRGDLDQDGYEELVQPDSIVGGRPVRLVIIRGAEGPISWRRLDEVDDDDAIIVDINSDGSADLVTYPVVTGLGYRVVHGPLDLNSSPNLSPRQELTAVMACDLNADRVPDLIGVGALMLGRRQMHAARLGATDGDGELTAFHDSISFGIACFWDGTREVAVYQDGFSPGMPGLIRLGERGVDNSILLRVSQLAASEEFGPTFAYYLGVYSANAADRTVQSLVFGRTTLEGLGYVDVVNVSVASSSIDRFQSIRLPADAGIRM